MIDTRVDWLPSAAAAAKAHLAGLLRARVRGRVWREFSNRFDERAERLLRLVHRVYGWRFDFAWIFEGLVTRTLDGLAARPDWLEADPQERTPGREVWVSPPDGMEVDVDYLVSAGVTHIEAGHGLPSKRLVKSWREAGLGLIVDLSIDHVAERHPWVEAARAGSPEALSYFLAFSDRTGPDSYARDSDDDAGFSWQADVAGGRWISGRQGPGFWDLDYRNPEALQAMLGQLLDLANRGVTRFRLHGLPHLWREAGRDTANLPESHLLLQVIAQLLALAHPDVELVAAGPTPLPYIAVPHERFIGLEECSLGYDPLLTDRIRAALEHEDVRPLTAHPVLPFPAGCRRIIRSNPTVRALEDAIASVDPGAIELATRQTLAAYALPLALGDVIELPLTDLIDVSEASGEPVDLLRAGLRRLIAVMPVGSDMRVVPSAPAHSDRLLMIEKSGFLVLVNVSGVAVPLPGRDVIGERWFDVAADTPLTASQVGPYSYRVLGTGPLAKQR